MLTAGRAPNMRSGRSGQLQREPVQAERPVSPGPGRRSVRRGHGHIGGSRRAGCRLTWGSSHCRIFMSTLIQHPPISPRDELARSQISSFIAATVFPCVGAKSALNKHRMRFGHYEALGGGAAIERQVDDLLAFSNEFPDPGLVPVSFVATYRKPEADEAQFEVAMWRHIQLMHGVDRRRFAWNPLVSADPDHNDFSLSIGGRAFFVVGMHPNASRLARRAPMPCLVFNFHDQFVNLKESGKYFNLQTAIRTRDTALQGSVNPVLARFGDASEARQYSGRAVEENWRCPFRPLTAAQSDVKQTA